MRPGWHSYTPAFLPRTCGAASNMSVTLDLPILDKCVAHIRLRRTDREPAGSRAEPRYVPTLVEIGT